MTGLAGVATKRVGGLSLGMGQRLGIAAERSREGRRGGGRAAPQPAEGAGCSGSPEGRCA